MFSMNPEQQSRHFIGLTRSIPPAPRKTYSRTLNVVPMPYEQTIQVPERKNTPHIFVTPTKRRPRPSRSPFQDRGTTRSMYQSMRLGLVKKELTFSQSSH